MYRTVHQHLIQAMCEQSPLLLLEAKSILFDLLTRTLDLFDLSLRFLEHYRLTQFLVEREQQRDYRQFSLYRPCRLNYNIRSDLDTYLRALHTSCRLIKSHLRSLHAARVTSTKDYIVIDDEIYEMVRFFQSKLKETHALPAEEEKPQQSTQRKRYHSQRIVHSTSRSPSFVFRPQTFNQSNNSPSTSIPSTPSEVSQQIQQAFKKISRFYGFLLERLYGVHSVRDSDLLQPIVISIIRLLLLIATQLKEKLQTVSPTIVHHNRFRVEHQEEVCHEAARAPTFQFIEIQPAHNANHSTHRREEERSVWEFDEEEFNRLANLDEDCGTSTTDVPIVEQTH